MKLQVALLLREQLYSNSPCYDFEETSLIAVSPFLQDIELVKLDVIRVNPWLRVIQLRANNPFL